MTFPITVGSETSQSLPRTQRLSSQFKSNGACHQSAGISPSSAGTSHQSTGTCHQEVDDAKDLSQSKPVGHQQVPEHLDPANRSPGTGRSSSGSDGEELILSR